MKIEEIKTIKRMLKDMQKIITVEEIKEYVKLIDKNMKVEEEEETERPPPYINI